MADRSLALRTLGAAVRSAASRVVPTEAIISTEGNRVIMRVPLVHFTLHWSTGRARAVAAALVRAADRIDRFRVVDTEGQGQ